MRALLYGFLCVSGFGCGGSCVRSSEGFAIECSGVRSSDDAEGAAEVVPRDASGRPRGARPTAKTSFAAGICIPRGLPAGRGTLQDELMPSHVVAALVLASALELLASA